MEAITAPGRDDKGLAVVSRTEVTHVRGIYEPEFMDLSGLLDVGDEKGRGSG